MLKRMKTNEGIQYERLTPEQMKAHGILGRLIGVCADFVNPTRNGRGYSEQLWENVFSNPIMQEKIKNGVCFGELGHPEDRTEIDIEKVAICLREQPVKNDKGQLCACFDILDTPNGRILKTLCDYGSTVGVSSRGQGDLVTDANGNEAVDPDTYECECFDVVLVPAVEAARMQYVKEGLDSKKVKLKLALKESLNKASEEEKKVMEKTLEELNIDLTDVKETVNESLMDEINALPFEEDTLGEELVEDKEEEEIPAEEPTEEPAAEETASEPLPDELPLDSEIETELELVPEGEPEAVEEIPAEENTEEEIDERTDEEIFLDYLANNFDEDQIKKACKALDIEIEAIEELKDEEAESEDVEEAEEEAKEDEGSDEIKEEEPEAESEKEEVEEEEKPEEVEESLTEEKECNGASCTDTTNENAEEEITKIDEANDDGSRKLVDALAEELKEKALLETQVKELQEKLAVSDTKVNDLTEDCNRYKEAVARLSVISKDVQNLKQDSEKLAESLKEKDAEIADQKTRIARLVKSKKDSVSESLTLTESVTAKTNEVATLNESLTKANEEIASLKEQLEKKESDSGTKVTELSEELTKATKIKESYKNLANKAVNKYIDVKATMLGLTATDIKRKLGESYSLDDVDKVCSDLQSYQINISRLPFDVNKKLGVKVNEAVNKTPINRAKEFEDDDVDDDLIRLSNNVR